MVLSLIAVTAVSMLGAGLVQIGGSLLVRQAQGIASTRAMYIAEAGLAEAYLAVAQGRSGKIGSPEEPAAFGGGVYWVEAQPVGDDQVSLSVHGLYDTGRFAIGATLDRRVHPLGHLGLASSDGTLIGARASVAGVASAAQPGGKTVLPGAGQQASTPASQTPPAGPTASTASKARIHSNGDVHMESHAEVVGDVQYGSSSILFRSPTATHVGESKMIWRNEDLPEIPVPIVGESSGIIGISPIHLGRGSHSFESIDVLASSQVVLAGPSVIVTEQLHVRAGGKLIFDSTEGAIELHVLGPVTFEPGSAVDSPEGQSASVGLFLHGAAIRNEPLALESTGSLHGIVYAPRFPLVIGARLQITGALLAGAVELQPEASFVFDEATLQAAVGLPALPRQRAWYILPLSEEPIVRSRRNVDAFLNQANIVPVPSAEAAAEQDIVLRYLDDSGVEHVFEGHASLVDWSNVAGVRSLAWVDEDTQMARSFDGGLGLLQSTRDNRPVGMLVPGGGVRSSIRSHVNNWPNDEMGFYNSALSRVPFTMDEIDVLLSLNPAPSPAFWTDLEDAHVAAGGNAW